MFLIFKKHLCRYLRILVCLVRHPNFEKQFESLYILLASTTATNSFDSFLSNETTLRRIFGLKVLQYTRDEVLHNRRIHGAAQT